MPVRTGHRGRAERVRPVNAVALLEHPDQPTLAGLDDLPRHPGRRGGAVRVYRSRSARPATSAAAQAEPAALWTGEETTAAAPAERRCADRAWPVHRVLHLVGQARLVLSASVYTRDADLDDKWCDVREPHRKGDTTAWIGPAENKALRELVAAGLVCLGHLGRYRLRGVWFSARPFELTPTGRPLWTRWAYLVDPELERQDRLAAELEDWKLTQKRRSIR